MKYVIIIVEPIYSVQGGLRDVGVSVLGMRDTIQEAEQYRAEVIKEDNLEPQHVSIVQMMV